MLFSLSHSSLIRGDSYFDFDNSNEMGLFSFLRENKNLPLNVDNIIKMYVVLSNDKNASFRKENTQIITGEKFYVPTSKENISLEMEELCKNFSHLNSPKEEDFDDIFKFILQFICIHPFSNGNGRLSSFLLVFLLEKFGLKYALYLPIDALMNGIYSSKTTFEIRKASGFFYKMKEYEYDSYIEYVKELIAKSYFILIDSINKINL